MTKITDLTPASLPLDDTDLIEVVQGVGTTPVNKKVPVSEIGGGGGGTGLEWVLVIDNPLTAMTGLTAVGGSWGINAGGILEQASTSASHSYLRVDKELTSPWVYATVELFFPTVKTTYAGIVVGPAAGTGGLKARYQYTGTWQIHMERSGQAALGSAPWPGGAAGAWRRLHLLANGPSGTAYSEEGTPRLTARISGDALTPHVLLQSHSGPHQYRNLKVWQLNPNLPTP
jgi:hypothetical protein